MWKLAVKLLLLMSGDDIYIDFYIRYAKSDNLSEYKSYTKAIDFFYFYICLGYWISCECYVH